MPDMDFLCISSTVCVSKRTSEKNLWELMTLHYPVRIEDGLNIE